MVSWTCQSIALHLKKTGMRLQQTVGMGFMTFADTFFFDKKLDNTVTFLMH